MTYEQAATGIKTWITCMRAISEGNEFANEFIDCAEYMIKSEVRNAVEKQEANKPKNVIPFKEMTVGICPNCEHTVSSYETYCSHCGKKLDWSKDND